jgi:lipopolysaccharide export system protein LptC
MMSFSNSLSPALAGIDICLRPMNACPETLFTKPAFVSSADAMPTYMMSERQAMMTVDFIITLITDKQYLSLSKMRGDKKFFNTKEV